MRDEADILEANIAYHLERGVDFIIATNNRSSDGSRSILERFADRGVLQIIDEPDDDYEQGRWVTRMARIASVEHGANWIINCDVDEFWWPRTGDLKSTLASVPRRYGAVRAPRTNFFPVKDEVGAVFRRMMVRDRRPLTELGTTLQPKIAHRANPFVEVAQGNHRLASPAWPVDPDCERILIFHFPLRTYAQYEAKIINGGQAYERNQRLERLRGREWRFLYGEYQRGRLRDYFDRYCVTPERRADWLESGELIEDGRLLEFFDRSFRLRQYL